MPRKKRKKFSRFYEKNIDKVYRFVYLKVSSKEVSEDLTAEAFKRFWEEMKSPTEIKNSRAFLYQVVRNLIIDHYRQRDRDPVKIPPEEVSLKKEGESPGEELQTSQNIKKMRQALYKLKDNYQNVLLWYYLEDMPVSEIAEIEGKSENAIRVTIHRALKSLRDELGVKESEKEDQNHS